MKRNADTVSDCIARRAATIMWLKGGHSLLLERGHAVASAVQRLVREFLSFHQENDETWASDTNIVQTNDEMDEDENEEEDYDPFAYDLTRTMSRVRPSTGHDTEGSRPRSAQSTSSYRSRRGVARPLSRDSQRMEDEADLRLREIESENQSRESERKLRLKKEERERVRETKQRARVLERHRREIEETAQKLRDDQVSKTEREMEKEENRAMAYEERIVRLAVRVVLCSSVFELLISLINLLLISLINLSIHHTHIHTLKHRYATKRQVSST
jgi:flagellar biosynthesis GTPase FlhF